MKPSSALQKLDKIQDFIGKVSYGVNSHEDGGLFSFDLHPEEKLSGSRS